MKPEEKNIQRSPNKQRCPTLLLFKKTPSRKTSELGEAIIVTTDRKTDIPSHVALTKTGRCINCQQQQSFPPHRTTKSIYIGNWPKWAIYEFCLWPGEMVFQRLSVQQIHWGGLGIFPLVPLPLERSGSTSVGEWWEIRRGWINLNKTSGFHAQQSHPNCLVLKLCWNFKILVCQKCQTLWK